MRIRPKNWEDFQHYKDRSPSWIKLHRSLLDNYEFQSLPVASRALAPMLWLIASEADQGIIDADPKKLSFRLRTTASQVTDALNPLIEGGFFSVVQDAIGLLAETERVASLEEEEENKKREEENKRACARDFDRFWAVCQKKVALPKAKTRFFLALKTVPAETLIEAMRKYTASRRGEDQKFTLHPATWLKECRWTDQPDAGAVIGTPEQIAADKDTADRLLKRGKYDPQRQAAA